MKRAAVPLILFLFGFLLGLLCLFPMSSRPPDTAPALSVQGSGGEDGGKVPAFTSKDTAALLRSIPILHKGRGQRLEPIRGSTPDPYDRPKGCQFAPRCDFCCEKCRQEMPSEVPVCDGHAVRCWNAEQVYAGHREEVEAV